jgi:uncharacterized protein (TIGR03086 family)
MQNILELHRRGSAAAHPVLARITTADLDRPTPCAGWDLRTLLEHMTGQDHGFAAATRAARAGEDVDVAAFHPGSLGAAPAATVSAGLDDVVAAFAEAGDLDTAVLLPEFGARPPLRTVAGMHLVDTLVHGWDVAATLGIHADYSAGLDDDLVAATLAISEQVPDDASREAPGAPFGHALPVDPDADDWTRTLTLLGRRPSWRPHPANA